MTRCINLGICLLLVAGGSSCQSASNVPDHKKASGVRVGGPCETCELIYIDMPEQVDAADTSAGWYEEGQKLLVTGTVYQPDGKTPAPNIIVYYWHTDHKGLYSTNDQTNPRATRHGHIRGWMKTGQDGKYSLYTIRPASYPNSTNPQHIHVLIKEPDIQHEYYIDEWLFDDDPLFKKQDHTNAEKRGGDGTLHITQANGLLLANHDIILGKNIPGYPEQ